MATLDGGVQVDAAEVGELPELEVERGRQPDGPLSNTQLNE